MAGKQEDPHQQRKETPRPASTGRGAASALDALIKRRGPPAQPQPTPAPEKR